MSNFFPILSATGLTAVGTNISTALQLDKVVNEITTVGSGTGVILPPAAEGREVVVCNASSINALLVYPVSGSRIGPFSASTAISLAANSTAAFRASSTTQWYEIAGGGGGGGGGMASLHDDPTPRLANDLNLNGFNLTAPQTATDATRAVTIVSGGTGGYSALQILTVVGGIGTAATIQVRTVDGSGIITAANVLSFGNYTTFPSNPVAVTVGSATFNLVQNSLPVSLSAGNFSLNPNTLQSTVYASTQTGGAPLFWDNHNRTLTVTCDFQSNDGGVGNGGNYAIIARGSDAAGLRAIYAASPTDITNSTASKSALLLEVAWNLADLPSPPDGWGPSIAFRNRSTTNGVPNSKVSMGSIQAVRDGADNQSKLVLSVNSPSIIPALTLLHDGTVVANNKTIRNVADPVNAQDVANKRYVDAATSGISSGVTVGAGAGTPTAANQLYVDTDNPPTLFLSVMEDFSMSGNVVPTYVPIAGAGWVGNNISLSGLNLSAAGTLSLTGNQAYLYGNSGLNLTGGGQIFVTGNRIVGLTDPTDPQDAATKAYVDAQAGGLSSPLTADLDAGSHAILNLTDPANPQDAATKAYVDAHAGGGGGGGFANPATADLDMSSFSIVANTAGVPSTLELNSNRVVLLGGPVMLDIGLSGAINFQSGGLQTGGMITRDLKFDDHGFGSSSMGNVGFTVPIDMTPLGTTTANKIINLADPTDPQDAATKAYVDASAGGGGLSSPLAADLDAGSHAILNLADPANPQDATNKAYVDTQLGAVSTTFLALTGGTLTGGLNLSSNQINNVADPSNPQDVATKSYVDTAVAPTFLTADVSDGTGYVDFVIGTQEFSNTGATLWVIKGFILSTVLTGGLPFSGEIFTYKRGAGFTTHTAGFVESSTAAKTDSVGTYVSPSSITTDGYANGVIVDDSNNVHLALPQYNGEPVRYNMWITAYKT